MIVGAPEWWRSAVVYQIYPRSFADTDGDGIGDLEGVVRHLDYVAELGADAIWLCPIYPSGGADNGYDIVDYCDVDPVYGSLPALDRLVDEAHSRGIRVVMDLVLNHTSDEHPWFVSSRASRRGPKSDWYIWRGANLDGLRGEPNNWRSFFSGPAWTYVPERDQYYLHLFSQHQPDLNWSNHEVRDAARQIVQFWVDRGIDGFRMDVVNFLAKHPLLPSGDPDADGLADGEEFFAHVQEIHQHIAELRTAIRDRRGKTLLTVGEMPGVRIEEAVAFTDPRRGELDMVFQFEHVQLDHGSDKWTPRASSPGELADVLTRWQTGLNRAGWNSLYWNNHDQPRVVSRYGDDTAHRVDSATALATALYLERGTPFIYQGEELGLTNVPFEDLGELRDVESLRYAAQALEGGHSIEDVLGRIRRVGRDNARMPMPWCAGPNGGFSSGTPWIGPDPRASEFCVEAQEHDPASVLAYYRRLLALRRSDRVFIDGAFERVRTESAGLFAYLRRFDGESVLVVVNLTGTPIVTEVLDAVGEELLSNGPWVRGSLAPWRAVVARA